MPDNAFPRYFAFGRDYSPLRGCICCDGQGRTFMVTVDGRHMLIDMSLALCEARVKAGRMVEATRQEVERQNEAWLRMSAGQQLISLVAEPHGLESPVGREVA